MAASWNALGRVFGFGKHYGMPIGQRRLSSRQMRLARAAESVMEMMEERVLLSAPPLPTVSTNFDLSISGNNINSSTPSIAYNPSNPQQLVAAFSRMNPGANGNQKVFLEIAYSTDGGLSWSGAAAPGNLVDPTTPANAPQAWAWATDATVAFDLNNNAYITYLEHATDDKSGALVLQKVDFSSGAPVSAIQDKVLYEWANQDRILYPTLTVDNNQAAFTDPDDNTRVQADPFSGNVYVAYATDATSPQDVGGTGWKNGHVIDLLVSTDGGNSFSTPIAVSDNPYFGNNNNMTAPRLVVSQGDTETPSLDPLNPAPIPPDVPGGQLSIIWDNLNGPNNHDQIMFDRIRDQVFAFDSDGKGGDTKDAVDPGGGAPIVPGVTDFPINTPVPDFGPDFNLLDLDVSVALSNPNLPDVQVDLVAPDGTTIFTLVPVPGAGTTGLTGTALGILNGNDVYTTFDDDAPRNILDQSAQTPWTGHFRPEAGSLLGTFGGFTAAQMKGTWTLRVTDNVATTATSTTPPAHLDSWKLSITAGLASGNLQLGLETDSAIATTQVRGAIDGNFPLKPAASPTQGIGPTPAIASDNTLGGFSAFEGRLYVAYVDKGSKIADNTDIELITSDDGGDTWSAPFRVNDDSATDGFSGNDRPQFQPSIAVDQTTGTVVLSFYDARNDAARARVATYVAASIDGGATFGPETYANIPNHAFDVATQAAVNIEPIPDNISAGNTNAEKTFGFGSHQGLAVYGGQVHPVWSGNLNGGADGKQFLDIFTSILTVPAGPRIVYSTMGAVSLGNDALNPPADDGSPQLTAFDVVFDWPIDPSTFDASDIVVIYRAPGAASDDPGTVIDVDTVEEDTDYLAVLPASFLATELDPLVGPFGPEVVDGARVFRVTLATPQTALGTYTYAIGPDISDRIRHLGSGLTPTGNTVTAAAAGAQINLVLPKVGTGGTGDPTKDIQTSTITVAGAPAGTVVDKVRVHVDLTHPLDTDLVLTLIAPGGRQVILSNQNGFTGTGQDYTGTIFDDDAADPIFLGDTPFTGPFQPEEPLSLLQGETVNGPWKLQIEDVSAGPGAAKGKLLGWSLEIDTATVGLTMLNGNAMDQNANGIAGEASQDFQTIGDVYTVPKPTDDTQFDGSSYTAPFEHDTFPLIVAGPRIISTSVPNQPVSTDNLVLNSTANSIDVVFDRDMDPTSVTAASVLRMMGPAGQITGPFTITADPDQADPDPLFPRTYRISFPEQSLSGTYTISLASTITTKPYDHDDGLAAYGDALDTNANAGLDALRGESTDTATVTFPYTGTAANIGDTTLDGTTVIVPITVNDSFIIGQDPSTGESVTVQLDITYPTDPDLTVILRHIPVGQTTGPGVLLFSNVGQAGTHRNFTRTLFDDLAQTPIANGGAPFFGRFKPQGGNNPALNVNGTLSDFAGANAQGTWQLEITSSTHGSVGTLNNFSLNFTKPLPTTGLGEPVADRPAVNFRIFTQDPTIDQSHNQWTPVGGASNNSNGNSGRIGGLAVDPSDPSGNTVFVAGASGGVWKSTNFLTADPAGPTYIPLTDFGPTFAINIGSIALFPRNNDPNQTIVVVGTGEGDTASASSRTAGGSQGIGFLLSKDGGTTWAVLDSTTNVDSQGNYLPISAPQRDHKLVGTATFKVLVDPKPTPTGDVIIYAALTGGNGGVWRSLDTGKHWTLMRAGDSTDIAFENNSGTFDAFSNPTGNLQAIYAAFRGEGVFRSANRGQTWQQMLGNLTGDPQILEATKKPQPQPVPVTPSVQNPNGQLGRIVLATPFLTGDPASDLIYQGWVYAAVVNADGSFNGLYLTKDFGQHWTWVRILTTQIDGQASGVASNDPADGNLPLTGGVGGFAGQGNYDISLGINPLNPNVVYVGGTTDGPPTGYIRVDVTGMSDPYSFYAANNRPDGGLTRDKAVDPSVVRRTNPDIGTSGDYDPVNFPLLNLIRDPVDPLGSTATVFVSNIDGFTNNGLGARWKAFDIEGTDQHEVVTMVDPFTHKVRIIIGDDQGVFTALDDDGTLVPGVENGTASTDEPSRNGNIQITQFYYGAGQPSDLAAQVAGAYFYGQAQDNGSLSSSPDVLSGGNIGWVGSEGDGTGVATNQSPDPNDMTNTVAAYLYNWPCCGGDITDFFMVNGVGRTFGLFQTVAAGNVPDPQWPFLGGSNFAVNPISGNQIAMSSQAGRIFGTIDQGRNWSVIGDPTQLDSSYAPAIAFGAPDINSPGGTDVTNFFVYAGTSAGKIFVTFSGGTWKDISGGLDGSTVDMIVTNPQRGSHEAYAVTNRGVYHIADSLAGNNWTRINGNLFNVSHNAFGQADQSEAEAKELTSIQADWRYLIPDGKGATFPALYVGGEGGVYRSLDDGTTWTLFPNQGIDGATVDGGYLPNVHVSDLDMILGQIDPLTGRAIAAMNVINPLTGLADVARGPNVLLATTYGRGSFVIRLAPVVLGTVALDPASDTGFFNNDGITADNTPTFTGFSMQSAFGSTIHVQIVDLDNNNAILGTGVTDASGAFSVTVDPNTWTADGKSDGVKHLGIQAYDDAGTYGEPTPITITLQAAPPPAPSAPDLVDASDSGSSATDNLTNVPLPTFTGTAQAGALVELLVNGGATVAGSAFADLNGNYTVTLTTPLAPDGTYNITARQTALAGNMSAESAALAVTEDVTAPVITISPVASVEGQVFTGVVAHFTDANPFGTALIKWGDGTTSAGSIVANPNGGDDVTGTHTFQKAGSLNVEVDITDAAGNAGSSIGVADATISNPAVVVTGGLSVNAVEGQSTTGLVLATFTDPGVAQPLSDYSATIDWGDASATSNGQISYNAQTGVFSVTGNHTYAEEGNFTINLTVHHQTNGAAAPDASGSSTAAVSDPPVVGGAALTIGGTEGTALGTRIVATFTDPGGAEALADYSATISWGDGSSSDVGTIARTTGNAFSVSGGHAYGDNGTYTLTVTINHDQTAPVTVTSTATIVSAPPVASISAPPSALAGADVTFSFGASDPSAADAAAGFDYQIDWGDGSSPTTFSRTAGNAGPNSADHVYATPDTYTITLTATDKDGASATATTQLTVANAQQAQDVVINNGDTQRSHINRIAFKIVGNSGPIRVSMSNLKLLFNGNTSVSLKKAKLTFNSSTGMNVLTTKALNLADGDYQLQVRAGGQLVPIDFIKLEGDATGDGQVSRGDLNLVAGRGPGTDLNNDGRTDNKDLSLVRKDMNHSLNTYVNRTLNLVGAVAPNIPQMGFGTVRVGGAPRRMDLLIRNNGDTSLFFTGLTMPKSAFYDFAVLGTAWGRPAQDFELTPGDSITVRVYLNPISQGKPASSITLRYSDDGVHFSSLTLPIKAANLVLPTRAHR